MTSNNMVIIAIVIALYMSVMVCVVIYAYNTKRNRLRKLTDEEIVEIEAMLNDIGEETDYGK